MNLRTGGHGFGDAKRVHGSRPLARDGLTAQAPEVQAAEGETPNAPTPAAAPQPCASSMPQTSAVDSALAAAAAEPAFTLESPSKRASCLPLRPGRYKLQVSVGQDTHAALSQLKELLRHRMPDGDLARIVELAIADLLQKVLKQRFAQRAAPKSRACRGAGRKQSDTSRASDDAAVAELGAEGTAPDLVQPTAADVVASTVRATVETAAANGHARLAPAGHAMGSPSRHVPRAVRRAVYERDGGQCAFVSAQGQRCAARGYLELHHEVPFARGGEATAANIKLTCRAHNALLAERDLGEQFMRRKLREARTGFGATAPWELRLFSEREQG